MSISAKPSDMAECYADGGEASGIRRVTVVPRSAALSTVMVPPRSSIARLQIAMPRPVPEVLVEK